MIAVNKAIIIGKEVQLNATIDCVGDLREILSRFTDHCRITPINIFYLYDKDHGGELRVELPPNTLGLNASNIPTNPENG